MILNAFMIWLIPVILSLVTTWFVYRVYLFNRLNKSWLLVALGFLLIALLRTLTMLKGEGFFPVFFENWYVYDPLLRISNSLCFIFGFWSLLKNFEDFDVVEKKIKKAVKKK